MYICIQYILKVNERKKNKKNKKKQKMSIQFYHVFTNAFVVNVLFYLSKDEFNTIATEDLDISLFKISIGNEAINK